jgi:hypothetical protein
MRRDVQECSAHAQILDQVHTKEENSHGTVLTSILSLQSIVSDTEASHLPHFKASQQRF